MAEDRDSKKSPSEVYASELARMLLPHYQATQTALTTVPATVPQTASAAPNLQSLLPVIGLAGAGALLLFLL